MELRHFLITEFDSPDSPGSGEKYMNRDFLLMIDAAAHLCKLQFLIVSGYRTRFQNDRWNDSSVSSHLIGKAAIIRCDNSKKRHKMISSLMEVGFSRIAISRDQKTIYVDNDDQKPDMIWLY
tara:strand:+ start:1822 stop:2187 length:366 start_codon:yes stop_codon:yes gene_type:complete